MQRCCSSAGRSAIGKRWFSSSNNDKIVASVLFERLPVVVPKIDPTVYAFQEFSGKGDYQIDYKPAPRISEADKTNDQRSLHRALDRRLYLLVHGSVIKGEKRKKALSGKPVWHFPEKNYESEENLRKCAESALESFIGDLSHTYFVGNAPMGHMVMQSTEDKKIPSIKRFFFKSQVIAANKFDIRKCDDFVWVTKDELLEYFPEQAEFLNKMIIS
ncbi:hypothetical protein KY284_019491 [Solanum tuberosum]|nr:hypothetical protein KY284_019491 [Solanum tuberosum]